MKLETVKSMKSANEIGVFVAVIVVDLDDGSGPKELDFGYHPDDPYGVTPEVTGWLLEHPEFNLTTA